MKDGPRHLVTRVLFFSPALPRKVDLRNGLLDQLTHLHFQVPMATSTQEFREQYIDAWSSSVIT